MHLLTWKWQILQIFEFLIKTILTANIQKKSVWQFLKLQIFGVSESELKFFQSIWFLIKNIQQAGILHQSFETCQTLNFDFFFKKPVLEKTHFLYHFTQEKLTNCTFCLHF